MSLVVVGLNHVTGPVELRERLAFSPEVAPTALRQLRKVLDGAGVVILSTCNRVEIYAHQNRSPQELSAAIRGFLSAWHDVPEEEVGPALYQYEGRDAVGHLFRVASSLDSLAVGETQILGQVHDAYLASQAEQAADKVIHALFQRAFSVAKKARRQSRIGEGKISIGSVAVDLAGSIFMDLGNRIVLVIGSGKMGELTLRSLVSKGVKKVLVMNRNLEKARALAGPFRGEALSFMDLSGQLHRADIVITSTAAPHFILYPGDFRDALKRRSQEPIFVIDIAVPRDVDPAVAELDNVYLYNVDDLQQTVAENIEARRQEIARCVEIVERGADQFMHWLRALAAESTIASMAEELRGIQEGELEKTLAVLPDLTEKQREEIRRLAERIVNRILQRPMTEIKQEIGHHDPGTVLHLVKRFFGLEESL